MRRPDIGDKHGGTYSHVFFVSISLNVVLESPVAVQTSAIRHQPFVYDQQRELAGQHLCVPTGDENKKDKIQSFYKFYLFTLLIKTIKL